MVEFITKSRWFKGLGTNEIRYDLPDGVGYPSSVKTKYFIECPVCKGSIKHKTGEKFIHYCKSCHAEYFDMGEGLFKLSIDKNDSKHYDFQYNKCNLPVEEWNCIAKFGKTLRETTLEEFQSGKIIEHDPVELNLAGSLKPKEMIVWVEQSELHEPRAVRNYGGGSVRVMKGVWIHGGQSESHQEMRHIDNGRLILTNRRLLFNGGSRTANIDLRKILNITTFSDGFKVNIENRQKPQFFASNDSEFWGALLTGTMKNISK